MTLKDDMKNSSIIIEDLDENDISSVLKKISDIQNIKKELNKLEEYLQIKIKIYLKERNWENYNDSKTNISIKLDKEEEVVIDKEKVKMLLSENQYNSVITVKYKEKIILLNSKSKEKLKKFSKKGFGGN
jgi:DNA-binding LytR/AlgR family response regulator